MIIMMGSMIAGRQPSKHGAGTVARAYILTERWMRETEREGKTEPGMGFSNLKAHPQSHTSTSKVTAIPTKPHLLILLK